ncbi:peroxiredoxin-like family protein [Altibacter sp.]|uniref:peroxiredoxin-like family protein n=1 Tax=Altibacter sp. TaxID=2024823 RepID=UPI000C93C7FA|nr:peroxiredoxin-like family protein [Altibacter sp.]MAP53921.1 alkyl hydroperoxide reductase [Altibacter sp.]
MIKPTEKVPSLSIDLVNGTRWVLGDQRPDQFTMMIFYRGLHCPVCKKYLERLQTKLPEFTDVGVNVIAISMDSEKRAKKTYEKWDIEDIPLGYGLDEATARNLGLYISHAIKDEEPDVFSEPGLFLVNPDGTLYGSAIQTMPFARPEFDALIKAITFVKDEGYPARGGK